MDIGRDIGVPVIDYPTRRGAIEGDVPHVSVTFESGSH
jgi:arylsulfatase